MFMCFHVSVCAYIEARGECLVSYSISLCLVPLSQSLSQNLELGWYLKSLVTLLSPLSNALGLQTHA